MTSIDIIINKVFGLENPTSIPRTDDNFYLPDATYNNELDFLLTPAGHLDPQQLDYLSLAVDYSALDAE